MVMWVVFTALGCGMTMFYAAKVKKTPEISVAYESDQYFVIRTKKQASTRAIPSAAAIS